MEQPSVIDLNRLRQSCALCGLHQLCLPAAIEGDDLQRLEDIVQSRRPLEGGDVLYRAGAPFRALYVVRSGSIKTTATNEQGETQILGFHLPGEILGFDAVNSDRHQCAAVALEHSTVCEVPYERLNSIAAQLPGLQRQLMRVISLEVVRDHDHLVLMGRRHAQQRLAIFLCSLSDRNRRLRRDPATILLSMSRADLANYLGLVVETVSRLFTRFQEQGVLEVRRKTVRIVDPVRLEAVASDGVDDQPPECSSAASE